MRFADARFEEAIGNGNLFLVRYGTVYSIGDAYMRVTPYLVRVSHTARRTLRQVEINLGRDIFYWLAETCIDQKNAPAG